MSAKPPSRPRVLIIGGGFAGVGAAQRLADPRAPACRRNALVRSLGLALEKGNRIAVGPRSRSRITPRSTSSETSAPLTVHLALLPTNADRAKAVVDWSGATITHQRTGRITVGADAD
jgi:hypothetical protein